MNVLFLTIGRMESIEARSIYPDLLRQFRDHGHNIYIVSPRERRTGLATELKIESGAHMLYVHIGNITKCNLLEKGISTILIEKQFKTAIKKYFSDAKFDLILYSTPPITLAGVVKYIKKRDKAVAYLLLKDIFPQNAVDIGMLSKKGIKGILYKYFRAKEKALYKLSDHIGCMSDANVEYVLKHNKEIDRDKIEVCPNCIDPVDMSIDHETRMEIRKKYNIPEDKIIFVYGGNLGKPQGIPFLIECLKSQKENGEVFFLIVGDGTEFNKLKESIDKEKFKNVKLMRKLPKDDYDRMVGSCDVGMIFLDHRFTIPNFPSRLLSYMQAKIPVLAVTDPNTDIGKVIVDGGFGWWCESNDVKAFSEKVQEACKSNRRDIGQKGFSYLEDYYTSKKSYAIVMNYLDERYSK